jgi:hypothetical protein
MPKGVTIPEPMCWTVVRMTLLGFNSGQIHYVTEISHRKQQRLRIMKIWRETDDVVRDTNCLPRGHLSADDITVRIASVQRTQNLIILVQFLLGSVGSNCDAYLDELRDSLSIICGKEVSNPTVWRALRRCGYRMKKMHFFQCCDVFCAGHDRKRQHSTRSAVISDDFRALWCIVCCQTFYVHLQNTPMYKIQQKPCIQVAWGLRYSCNVIVRWWTWEYPKTTA